MIEPVPAGTLPAACNSKQMEIAPVLDRFELKYTIPFSLVGPISDFIAPYCSLDKYSECSPDLFYIINSLYFDTPDFTFLRNRLLRAERRFNMRIRSYGARPEPPYFLEIKQRLGDVVKKFRSKVYAADLETLIFDGAQAGQVDDKNRPNCELFRQTFQRYNAQPVVLVQYKRKAYISCFDEYARVTFDAALRSMPRKDYIPLPLDDEMIPCDFQNGYDPGTNVILELKCYTEFVPLWMIDMVRTFQLTRRGFSKYATCLRPVLERYRYDPGYSRASTLLSQMSEESTGED